LAAGKLEFFLRYNRAVLTDAEAEQLACGCEATLEEIGSAAVSPRPLDRANFRADPETPEYHRSFRPGAPKVFFFPPKLSLGLSYLWLTHHLSGIELVAFDFIERQERIAAYLEYITRLQPCGPYILGAYSSATLALEVAQALRHRGATVSDMILLDAFPTVRTTDTLTSSDRAAESIEFFRKSLRPLGGQLDADFTRATEGKIREYSRYINGTCNRTVLDTTFHFIKSASTGPEALAACQSLSCRELRVYEGFGEHGFMLSGSAARKNALVIHGIVLAASARAEERA
jgi:surfactin family lipopeptide synthetase C/lichenysin synthetase C